MPLSHPDTKAHKELLKNIINLVNLGDFETLWQKITFRSRLNQLTFHFTLSGLLLTNALQPV